MAVKYTVPDMRRFRREEREIRDRGIDGVRLKPRTNVQLWRTSTITWTSIMWDSNGDDIETLVEVSLDQWLSTWATRGTTPSFWGPQDNDEKFGCHSNLWAVHQTFTAWIIKSESKVSFCTVFPAAQKSCLLCKPKQVLRTRQGKM